jgi:hypothetical protein
MLVMGQVRARSMIDWREVSCPQVFYSCAQGHVTWTWAGGSKTAVTPIRISAFMRTARVPRLLSDAEFGGGEMSRRSWNRALPTEVRMSRGSHTACSAVPNDRLGVTPIRISAFMRTARAPPLLSDAEFGGGERSRSWNWAVLTEVRMSRGSHAACSAVPSDRLGVTPIRISAFMRTARAPRLLSDAEFGGGERSQRSWNRAVPREVRVSRGQSRGLFRCSKWHADPITQCLRRRG